MKRVVLRLKLFLSLLAFCVSIAADASVCVKDVEVHQRYPWNGLVDITVTLTGPSNELAHSVCYFVASNNVTHVALPVTHIDGVGNDVQSEMVRIRRYVWNATADVGAVKIPEVALTVDASGGIQLWENGPYWAECNVGATRPEEYGYYFWWGDTVGYKRNAGDNGWISVKDGAAFMFYSENCPTCGMNNSQLQSEGYIEEMGSLVSAHDAATAHLGAPWRMPTGEEMYELIDNCYTTWTTRGGVYGCLVTGRGAYASKSIFLPAACGGGGSYLGGTGGSYGAYWSSAQCLHDSDYAWRFVFNATTFRQDYDWRSSGLPVRPLRGFAD